MKGMEMSLSRQKMIGDAQKRSDEFEKKLLGLASVNSSL